VRNLYKYSPNDCYIPVDLALGAIISKPDVSHCNARPKQITMGWLSIHQGHRERVNYKSFTI
jgi:hypothetical protein